MSNTLGGLLLSFEESTRPLVVGATEWWYDVEDRALDVVCQTPVHKALTSTVGPWWNQNRAALGTVAAGVRVFWPGGPGELFSAPALVVDALVTCDARETRKRYACDQLAAASFAWAVCSQVNVQLLADRIDPALGAAVRGVAAVAGAVRPVMGPMCEGRLPRLQDVMRYLEASLALSRLVAKLDPKTAAQLAPLFEGVVEANAKEQAAKNAERMMRERGILTWQQMTLGVVGVGALLYVLL